MNGTMYAFHRMHEAWKATQPQLFWTDENLYGGLDERRVEASPLVEPAPGFNSGAEPRCATHRALTALCAAPPATPNADGSAPYQYDGPGANHIQVARRGQEGA